jgi:hypothetical protein
MGEYLACVRIYIIWESVPQTPQYDTQDRLQDACINQSINLTYLDDGPVPPEEVRGAGVAVGHHVELLQKQVQVLRPCFV